jgi:hypothetical protein
VAVLVHAGINDVPASRRFVVPAPLRVRVALHLHLREGSCGARQRSDYDTDTNPQTCRPFTSALLHSTSGCLGGTDIVRRRAATLKGRQTETVQTFVKALRADATARLIDEYAIAFLDRYLKGDAGPLSRLNGAGVAEFTFEQ